MRVLTAGCFDILHVGHINMLLFARQIAGNNGEVIVSLDTDEKIMADKGFSRPIHGLDHRRNAIHALRMYGNRVVDIVHTHGDNDQLYSVIKQQKPDYIVVSEIYRGRQVIGSDIANIIMFPHDQNFSTTKIIEACQAKKY